MADVVLFLALVRGVAQPYSRSLTAGVQWADGVVVYTPQRERTLLLGQGKASRDLPFLAEVAVQRSPVVALSDVGPNVPLKQDAEPSSRPIAPLGSAIAFSILSRPTHAALPRLSLAARGTR